MTATARPTGASARDPRLDFFRGMSMFIILFAHTPGNVWTLWIPARFGFSDAADVFVFCSGLASALAFGTVFVRRGWHLGAARIAFRIWQVYWAHIGIFLVTAMLAFAIDHYGLGNSDRPYTHTPYVVPFFEQTGEAMLGLMTLTYVPGLFDILPMYLVILAMVPVLMLFHRFGGLAGVVAMMALLWLGANLSGYAATTQERDGLGAVHLALLAAGDALSFLQLPNNPFGEGRWFFNPFGWQVVFFTGFAFGMGWFRPPQVTRGRVIAVAAFVVAVIPFAWFKIHQGLYLPGDWAIRTAISALRDATQPLWWKTDMGLLRYLHFLALAYLAWAAVGDGGRRLVTGFAPPRAAGPLLLLVAGIVALATIPYTYVSEIQILLPRLDAWIVYLFGTWAPETLGFSLFATPERIGLFHLAHLAAVTVLVWAALGPALRERVTRDAFLSTVPVIRKVGTQSLAVFMVSIPLARFNGWMLDLIGRDAYTWWLVNGAGALVLIATAYGVSWFKSQPWRRDRNRPAPAPGPKDGGSELARAA